MSEPIAKPIEASTATWLGFLLMCLGMFMAILDIQVVATSLPNIQQALSISQDAMSWIQTAYLIAEIIAIPLSGWITRVLTLRWLFVGAICIFTVASIGCAFSGNFAVLVSFRVLQGFAGGMLIPAVFSAVFLLFPVRLHPLATTIAGVMAVLAPTVGPVVGGWITETWSWQWLLLINVAPAITAGVLTPFLLPRAQPRFADFATLDILSLALMVIALASLEIGLKQAPHGGWLSPLCSILFLLSAAAAAVFAVRSLKAKQARPTLVIGSWVRAVRDWAGLECVAKPGRRLRRDVLASGVARCRHHVLPAAAGAAGVGGADGSRSAKCQRPVQPDAKPRWGNRDRIDRHNSIRTQRRTRRSATRPVTRRGCHRGRGDRARPEIVP